MSANARIVPARNGTVWLVAGFMFYRKNPAMWLLLIFTYWIGTVLLGSVPWIGAPLMTLLLPAFSVSFMAMCAELEQGGMLKPALLFSGFRAELPALFALGACYLACIAVSLALSSLADGGAFMNWTMTGQAPQAEVIRDGILLRALIVTSLAALPILMAFWFAPVLAAWEKMGAGKALFFSFFACWRNWRAFLVYGATLMAIGSVFVLLIAVLAPLLREQTDLLRSIEVLAMIFVLPTMFGSFYASYRDIFPEGEHPVRAAS